MTVVKEFALPGRIRNRAKEKLSLKTSLVAAAALIWLAGIVAGGAWLMRYSFTPAPTGAAVMRWPQGISEPKTKATLVMALHPHCPCSRASLEQLSRILARSGDRLSVLLLFYNPANQPPRWAETGLWRQAKDIPGAKVVHDTGGSLAQRFGLSVSGETAVYDAAGALAFRGGITAGRGHAGDNPGTDAVFTFVTTARSSAKRFPVFGCSLLSRASAR